MGSAAANHLARRGQRVVGFDRFTPPHAFGSSHGESRVFREAYWEDPIYVPMVQRAYELWTDLEREAGKPLFRKTGAVFMGVPDGVMVPGCRRTAAQHKLAHRNLTVAEIRSEYPMLHPRDDMIGFFEPRAGILNPEACIQAHLDGARKSGADLRFNDAVREWKPLKDGLRLSSARGDAVVRRLVLTAGSWMSTLLGGLHLPLTVERQVLYWFVPKGDPQQFEPSRCPIYAFEPTPEKLWYGFPNLGNGCKVALHHQGETIEPDRMTQAVRPDEVAAMRMLLRQYIPDLDGSLRATSVCMYTNTPDFHYLIDVHPDDERVIVASPCSGHGFKYASVVGEIVADLVTKGRSQFDLSLFRMERLRPAA